MNRHDVLWRTANNQQHHVQDLILTYATRYPVRGFHRFIVLGPPGLQRARLTWW